MREITLTRGLSAKVDDEDFDRITNVGRWYADVWHGARIYAKNQASYMHRMILNNPKTGDVDHINGDTLDNRKENLRVVDRSTNMLNANVIIRIDNKSGRKGVHFDSFYNGWKAEIKVAGKKFHLGIYKEKEEAFKAREKAENRLAEGLPPK